SLGDTLTALIRFLVRLFPLRAGECAVAVVVTLQRFAHHESSRIRDGALGYQTAAERNFAHQFPCNRAPPESAACDTQDRPCLQRKTRFAAARGGDEKRHPHLI